MWAARVLVVRLVVICTRSRKRTSRHKPETLQAGQGLNESNCNTGASLDLPRPGSQMAVEK